MLFHEEFANLLKDATIIVDNAHKPLHSATDGAKLRYPVLCRYPKPSFREHRERRRRVSKRSSSCCRWESVPSVSACDVKPTAPSSSCSSFNHDTVTFFHISATMPLRMPLRSYDECENLASSPTSNINLIGFLEEALAISDDCLHGKLEVFPKKKIV
jgi:hypothetical protein